MAVECPAARVAKLRQPGTSPRRLGWCQRCLSKKSLPLLLYSPRNGMTVMRPGMELSYERDAKAQTSIEDPQFYRPGCASI